MRARSVLSSSVGNVDEVVLDQIAVDRDRGFETMVRSLQHFVYGVAVRLTVDRRDAEEVAQETFVRAYRALCGYDSDRIRGLRLRPWLAQIALNVQRNRVRRRVVTTVPITDADIAVERDTASPDVRAEAGAQRDELVRLLDKLPEVNRVAIVLRHVEELTYAEVADAVGKPIGTVKAHVHRGIAMLREGLSWPVEA